MSSIWQKIIQYFFPPVNKSEDAQHETQTSPPVLRAELQIPHTIVERYETYQQEYAVQERERAKIDRWRLGVEFVTFVSVIGGSVLLYKTLAATQESNRINREALTSVQRAYVGLKAIQVYYVPDAQGSIAFWDFRGEWENSGTTPTRTLRQHFNYEWRDKPFPDDYDFPDKGPDKNITIFIAPRATVLTGSMAVPPDVLRRVQEGKQHLYFWGWTVYRDVFENSELHLTEFCREVITIYGDAMKGTGARVVSTYCSSRNCVDKDCKDYAEAEMKLQGK